MRTPNVLLLSSALLFALAACDHEEVQDTEDVAVETSELSPAEQAGSELFHEEEFDGNGRTCATCHSGTDGTISPSEVEARFQADPSDPLFRPIDSDDGSGASYDNLRSRALIRVTLPLPPNVRAADDPEATTVTFLRGVPTTNNVAAADGKKFNSSANIFFNHDGRADTVEQQALGAINAHYEPGRQPTQSELNQLGAFQRTLFSSAALETYLTSPNESTKPGLPQGNTQAEKNGRAVFQSSCNVCHTGPLLNRAPSLPGAFQAVSGGAPGGALSSADDDATVYINPINEVREWIFTLEDGSEQRVISPDLGRAAITGRPGDTNKMKIPVLWGIGKTAPYFSDNHATTLEEVADHYQEFFDLIGQGGEFQMSDGQKADLVAFLKLL